MKITDYHFGHIEVEGVAYSSDVIVTADAVRDGWWRKEGHELAIEDLDAVVDAQPDVVVIGSGYFGRMKVPESSRAFLQDKGIQVQVLKTGDAVSLFNELQGKYARVVAALHLTC
jgi:hypothetical protein